MPSSGSCITYKILNSLAAPRDSSYLQAISCSPYEMNKEYFFHFLASGENHFIIQSNKKHLCEATYVILMTKL